MSPRWGGIPPVAVIALVLWAFGSAGCAGEGRSQAGRVPAQDPRAPAPTEKEDRVRRTVSAYGIQAWRGSELRGPDFRLLRADGVGLSRFDLLTSNRDDRGPPAIPTYDAR